MKSILALTLILCSQMSFAQSTCEPVPETHQKLIDCRYQDPKSDWSHPILSEWSRDIKGMRSGVMNIYVHTELEDLRKALTLAGWSESLAKNKKDNKEYLGAAAAYEHYRLRIAELRHLQSLLQRKKFCKTQDSKICETPEKIGERQSEIKAKMDQLNQIVQAMPVSNEYVCSEMELTAFERDNDPFGGRHHLRIFATGKTDAQGLTVFGIVANRDTGIVIDKNRANQAFLNHAVEPNADNERNKVISDLTKIKRAIIVDAYQVRFECAPPLDKATSEDKTIFEIAIPSDKN